MKNKLLYILLFGMLSTSLRAQDTLMSQVLSIETINVENYFLLLKKTQERAKYIEQLKEENNKLNDKIVLINNYLTVLNSKLEKTRTSYSKLLVFVYLNKFYSYNTFSFILSAKNFNEAFFRYKYIEIITQYIKKLHTSIKTLKKELTYQKQTLQKTLELQKGIIKKIEHQKALNQEDIAVLNQIEQNQKLYMQFIESLKEYEKKQEFIFSEINKSINMFFKADATQADNMFEAQKGKLNPPLKNAEIVIPYGVHRHSSLKRVKITNNGVDLISNDDNAVKAVFQGKVVKIIPLPNYKYAVLIKHGDYFTVYSNLDKVSVKEGANVLKSQIIGTLNSNPNDKSTLNFQIWYKTKKLNPQKWIKF